MTPDKVVDALSIKLGWLEINAVGQMAVAAVFVLALLCLCTRLWLKMRRGKV
jgi:hypothetical protein